MSEQERATNYIQAFDQLITLISEIDNAIDRAGYNRDKLGVKQYTHLKKGYVQQLADLISRAPHSVRVRACWGILNL